MSIAATNVIVRAVVPKATADIIKRFAKISGKSTSSVISEFLVEAEPSLRRLAGMMEVAKSQRSLFPKATLAELEAALDDMSGNATEVLDRVEKSLQLPLEPSKHGKRASAASGATGRRRRGR